MTGHKFNPGRAKALDGWLRRKLLPPAKVIGDISPAKAEVWGDVGCGTGYFTVPLAALTQRVYAIDVSERMLGLLRERIEENGIRNVTALHSTENSLPLESGQLDAILLAFVAHEAADLQKFLMEMARCLKPGGRLVVIEFTEDGLAGPPKAHRLSPTRLRQTALSAGLKESRSFTWGRSVLRRVLASFYGREFVK